MNDDELACYLARLSSLYAPLVIRMRYKQAGGHVHCRVFTAAAADQTFAKSGDLVFRESEWDLVRAMLAPAVEFLPEEQ